MNYLPHTDDDDQCEVIEAKMQEARYRIWPCPVCGTDVGTGRSCIPCGSNKSKER